MRTLLFIFLLVPLVSHARFMASYDFNYSSETSDSNSMKADKSRIFHKIYFAGSLNRQQTLFIGWNINKWSSESKTGTTEVEYDLLEMGPKLLWFFNENYNWYISGEWSPYARGERNVRSTSEEISGSGLGAEIGYRFRVSRTLGIGAGLHYQSTSIDEAKIKSNEKNVSDSVSHIMPMLTLTAIFR